MLQLIVLHYYLYYYIILSWHNNIIYIKSIGQSCNLFQAFVLLFCATNSIVAKKATRTVGANVRLSARAEAATGFGCPFFLLVSTLFSFVFRFVSFDKLLQVQQSRWMPKLSSSRSRLSVCPWPSPGLFRHLASKNRMAIVEAINHRHMRWVWHFMVVIHARTHMHWQPFAVIVTAMTCELINLTAQWLSNCRRDGEGRSRAA